MKHPAQERFHLHDGQFFAGYQYKNLRWYLNGEYIGFGDLTPWNLDMIQHGLEAGEVFEGYNEHHDTPWQQVDYPMVWITCSIVKHRNELRAEHLARKVAAS